MPRITKDNPITNYISREELARIHGSIDRAVVAQENQKLARIQLVDALNTALDMFKDHPELREIDAAFPRGSVYGIVKAAVARIQEARL
jgi:hypothetical protein